MNTRNISWEIVLAGLTFVAIAIYLFNHDSSPSNHANRHPEHAPPAVAPPSGLPSAIVIDLQNLESLKNLEDLKHLQDLEELKVFKDELRNIDQLIEQHRQNDGQQQQLDSNLKQLEAELQKIESADYKIKLRNQKLYINKNYNVDEAQWTEVKPGTYVYRKSFDTSDLKSMDVKLSFGNLNLVGENGSQGQIVLRATGDIEDPAAFSDKLDIEEQFNQSDGTFIVASADGNRISDHINMEATITIPRSLAINASTAGGHINAANLASKQHLNTSGGHINLTGIQGETVAKTAGGHITCDELSGNIVLTTGGGHIRVNQVDGTLTAKTGGGHIEIQDASGTVTAKTSGGNISTTMAKAEGPLKFATSAGNVSLFLPADIKANLKVDGSTVNLASPFDFSGTQNKGRLDGTLNGGGIPIEVSCGFGNVNISTN